jgi:glycosyltransferase involved in cell wall biosynthesis
MVGHYPPPWGGESIHVKQLTEFVRDRGMHVEVLNLNWRAIPAREYRTSASRCALIQTLFALADDSAILHLHAVGHNWKSWCVIVAAGLAARLQGITGALTVHSGLFPRYVGRFGLVRRWLARWVLRSFARIICVNEEIRKSMEQLGVGASRPVVISPFMGVGEVSELSASDERLVEQFHPAIVAVGGGDSDPERGLPTVVHACKELLVDMPRLGVIFLGERVGPTVRPLTGTLGLSQNAVCLGEVRHERCLSLIRAADVVVRSTFADGDSIAVREAFALGVPVVASDTAFRPDGVTLFQKGNAADLLRQLRVMIGNPNRPFTRGIRGGEPPETTLWRVYLQLADARSTGSTNSPSYPR